MHNYMNTAVAKNVDFTNFGDQYWRRRTTHPIEKPSKSKMHWTTQSRDTSWRPQPSHTNRFMPQCRHGADCVKYGCLFRHPPNRRKECPLGRECVIVGCNLLHPRPVNTNNSAAGSTAAPTSASGESLRDLRLNLKPGTIVLFKRQPADPVWLSAKVICLNGQTIRVNAEDKNEAEDLPLSAIRCPPPKTRCRHGAACVKFGCMFVHPPSRRPDCPRGAACPDAKCTLLHPATRRVQPLGLSASSLPAPMPTCASNSLSHTSRTHAGSNATTTAKAELALKLLVDAVESDTKFLSVPENRRMLKILGLKAQKAQAVIDEDYESAFELKNQIEQYK